MNETKSINIDEKTNVSLESEKPDCNEQFGSDLSEKKILNVYVVITNFPLGVT